jgi:hypothetical protein
MSNITITFNNDGGTRVLKNVFAIKYLGDETHYFICDSDLAMNHVMVTEDNVFVREYKTQSFNAI